MRDWNDWEVCFLSESEENLDLSSLMALFSSMAARSKGEGKLAVSRSFEGGRYVWELVNCGSMFTLLCVMRCMFAFFIGL